MSNQEQLDPLYGKMEDVGRRIDHLMDLQRMWSDAVGIIEARSYTSTYEDEQKEKLQAALEMLNAYLGNTWEQWVYGRTINALPKDAKEILDSNLGTNNSDSKGS